ncbi:hypothetical protein BSKO_06292 [Bryopsis sp. KO-2023]|nr:hypothetical protein BSKO_06292 [Bryopsis sp. KO-2023]
MRALRIAWLRNATYNFKTITRSRQGASVENFGGAVTTASVKREGKVSRLFDAFFSSGTMINGDSVEALHAHHASSAEVWRRALEKVVPACVVLRVTQVRPLDTESAGSSYATGFIVDRERGIILTNRHVVTPGPTTSEAIFLNREEVTVRPLYYDPIHDFAFLRFNPKNIQFMDLQEVSLSPESASVGLEVRVVGNDSGEKVSILAGTLARLDRDAPIYGRKGYNDFNTFYLQAASGTKGGSSGSPVVDCHGRAVGLNAGGKNKAASAYYLPLERVVRALKILQQCKVSGGGEEWRKPHISRGDLQTTFYFKGFDEVRRMGLNTDTEKLVRSEIEESESKTGPATGMLVVDSVLLGGPADGILQAGDVLVKMDSKVMTHFLPMEELLDSKVGETVEVTVDRGGKRVSQNIRVADVHAATPSTFLEFAGGSIHALSYQQARNNSVRTGQVYVAEPGYVLSRAEVPKNAVITKLDGIETPNLETFAGILKRLEHGERVSVEYYTFYERHRRQNSILQMDRQWYGPPVYWTRDDAAGIWRSTENYPRKVVERLQPKGKDTQDSQTDITPESAIVMAPMNGVSKAGDFESNMRRSMVLVDVDIPLVALADGVHSKSFLGSGVVVHHTDRIGLVLVDRNTVAIGSCDIMLSFGAYPAEISAHVRFLHPLHNFAVLSYDPSKLPAEARAQIRPVEILPTPPLNRGDTVSLVGLTESLRIMQRQSTVTNATLALVISPADIPRFRAVHEELVKLDQDFGSEFSGIITDQDGAVRALWGSYAEQVDRDEREWCGGLHAEVFLPWIKRLKEFEENPMTPPPDVWVLNAELQPLLLSKAAHLGLPSRWITRLAEIDPNRRQVLTVRSCVAKSYAADVLRDNDMILAVNGHPISCFQDVEKLILQQVEQDDAKNGSPPRKRVKFQRNSKSGEMSYEISCNGGGESMELEQGDGCTPNAALPSHSLKLTIFRDGGVMDVDVKLGFEPGMATDRLVHWCGAQLQAPHRAVRELGFLPEKSGVYVSRWHHGSPAQRYGLYALHWVTELNGVPTPDLDTFLEVARKLKDGSFVRVNLCHLETTKPKVLTLKLDLCYWPTWELTLNPLTCEWSRHLVV